ncbi:MAG TPA: translesion error-prone DNA polymerase V autoproteolytic subunit [Methylophilus sp.]|nr:translesion error-prone DNA polymerase V autoproteolytic subunit [Methylophilus sp.]
MHNDNHKHKGGKQPGAGRKPGSITRLEDTVAIRIPASQKPVVSELMQTYYAKKQRLIQFKKNLDSVALLGQPAEQLHTVRLSLFQSKVPAGFPSPADDHIETRLDTNEYLIDQPDTTFFVTIQGDSMIGVGLMPGDKAVVDKGKKAVMGDIVLAMIDGEFTIKTLAQRQDGSPQLLPANASGKYKPILIHEPMQFEIWGVVTGSFRRFR